jgi:NAD(P)-dependent dehydrogenase (short-subunit alcohol dehydrogenase family)
MTAVLITGTSSGIGRATALRLARHRDLTVYATARRVEAIAELGQAGARLLPLDVTDEASMRTAFDAVEAEHGAVGVLVNNAGYGEYGTVEEVDLDRVRAQFETNVFGLARMCQLVPPGMRAAGWGRIISVGSMDGRLVFPVGGYYHATKYAVEALTDALRFEVASFGVKVILIEPGLIRTGFGSTAGANLAGAPPRRAPIRRSTPRPTSRWPRPTGRGWPLPRRPWPRSSKGRSLPATPAPATWPRLGPWPSSIPAGCSAPVSSTPT